MRRVWTLLQFIFLAACTHPASDVSIPDPCRGISGLDIPQSALLGQWQETEKVEMRAASAISYWIMRNHVLTREGQITTREQICADDACIEPKAELTHFGTYDFDMAKGTLLKSYRKHFYTSFDNRWMKTVFALEKCSQLLPGGDVIALENPNCLDVLQIHSQEIWRLEGASLQRLALKNCGPKLHAESQLTRELVRMF